MGDIASIVPLRARQLEILENLFVRVTFALCKWVKSGGSRFRWDYSCGDLNF